MTAIPEAGKSLYFSLIVFSLYRTNIENIGGILKRKRKMLSFFSSLERPAGNNLFFNSGLRNTSVERKRFRISL